ncbi:DUF3667 domain-containing protein [Sphingomonas sabuli]|uniref:DUF3667 domain-containing protein n=1 Tax=Sphingomonas sabuli TaxID=2764186 RepID=A0A7G9L1F8_9SPHN|nr:DUF3667 domain-containing protein [Sphingomonas sabuli]QNM82457.1 DUF3667 domain-containing protein [Sphingomonas sabuli]
MPDFEAVGDAVTGGIVARAVEPAAGEQDGRTHETRCLNCGCELVGKFCHCCGQHAHVHRTIGAWWHDFLHSVLHLDGKFARTMPLLALHPGQLTRRYAHGQRAQFISPLALFLFTVFLMFAVFSALGHDIGEDFGISRGVEASLTEQREALQKLERRKAEALTEGDAAEAGRVDQQIPPVKAEIRELEKLKQDGVSKAVFSEDAEMEGAGTFTSAYKKAKQNPELLLYKIKANAYKFSWALIPISVPFVWVLFLHRRRYRERLTVYDHLVFVTYSIAFMSLWLIVLILLGAAGLKNGIVDAVMYLIPPVHMYRQLRGTYDLSRWSAAWRTVMLLLFASLSLGLFGTLLVLIGTGLG